MERSGNSAPVPCARLWYAGPCVGMTAGPRPTAASRQAGGQLGPASGGPGMGELAGWQPSPTFLGQGWGARLARKRRQTPQASTPLQSGTSGRPEGAIRVTSPPSGEGGHAAERGAVHGDVRACEGLRAEDGRLGMLPAREALSGRGPTGTGHTLCPLPRGLTRAQLAACGAPMRPTRPQLTGRWGTMSARSPWAAVDGSRTGLPAVPTWALSCS